MGTGKTLEYCRIAKTCWVDGALKSRCFLCITFKLQVIKEIVLRMYCGLDINECKYA